MQAKFNREKTKPFEGTQCQEAKQQSNDPFPQNGTNIIFLFFISLDYSLE